MPERSNSGLPCNIIELKLRLLDYGGRFFLLPDRQLAAPVNYKQVRSWIIHVPEWF